MKTVWIGSLPEYQGYGISVAHETETKCINAMKVAYYAMRKNSHGKFFTMSFDKAMENFGGLVREVPFGKAYYDNFWE